MDSVDSFDLPEASAQIPEGYTLNQVHILHRHWARCPCLWEYLARRFASKIHTQFLAGMTLVHPVILHFNYLVL